MRAYPGAQRHRDGGDGAQDQRSQRKPGRGRFSHCRSHRCAHVDGLAEAIRRGGLRGSRRGHLFVELAESEDEMATIGRELGDKLLLANMVEGGGRTPMLSNPRLAEIGYAIAIHPMAGILIAAAAALSRQSTGSILARRARPSAPPRRSTGSPRRQLADGVRGGVAVRRRARGALRARGTSDLANRQP